MKTDGYFLLLALFLTANSAAAGSAGVSVSTKKSSEFIRRSCSATLYPQLCYRSLYNYSNKVKGDPARLAVIAIGVSFSGTKRMSSYLSSVLIPAETRPDPLSIAALRDCRSVFRSAVEQIGNSLKQMRNLTGAGEELAFQVSNVQTWMSAALTDEATCTDGFEEVADGPMKHDICNRTVKVMQVTSNALALVNNFVAKIIIIS